MCEFLCTHKCELVFLNMDWFKIKSQKDNDLFVLKYCIYLLTKTVYEIPVITVF